jgi:UDP-N-acetyl-D-mannosaminuronate dehydrogenase
MFMMALRQQIVEQPLPAVQTHALADIPIPVQEELVEHTVQIHLALLINTAQLVHALLDRRQSVMMESTTIVMGK